MKKLSFSILLYFFVNVIIGQNIPEKPTSYQSVVDEASILSADENMALSSKLDAFEKETGNELVIVTVNSLKGSTVEEYAHQLFNTWGIGKKAEDNGVLILVSVKDRKMRIETGYAVEEFLTDAECSNIVNELIKPEFRLEKYYEGLELATNYIIKELKSDFEFENYRLRKTKNIRAVKLESKIKEADLDLPLHPFLLFLLTFSAQILAGIFIMKKLKIDEGILYLFIGSVLYGVTGFILNELFKDTRLFIEQDIKVILVILFPPNIAVAVYLFVIQPKKHVNLYVNLMENLFAIVIAVFLSVIFASYSIYVIERLFFDDFHWMLIVLFIVFAALFFYLFITGRITKWLDSGSSYSSGGKSYSGRSSSSSRSSGSRSYGGGRSGGGGASGSW
jgi:uncharacterized protein